MSRQPRHTTLAADGRADDRKIDNLGIGTATSDADRRVNNPGTYIANLDVDVDRGADLATDRTDVDVNR